MGLRYPKIMFVLKEYQQNELYFLEYWDYFVTTFILTYNGDTFLVQI